MTKFVLAVALVVCLAYVSEAAIVRRDTCAGCPVEQDPSQYPELLNKLKAALATAGSNSSVEEIIKYRTQVVAGTKHIVEYKDKNKQTCTATWVDQPWVSPQPQYVTIKC